MNISFDHILICLGGFVSIYIGYLTLYAIFTMHDFKGAIAGAVFFFINCVIVTMAYKRVKKVKNKKDKIHGNRRTNDWKGDSL